MKKFVNTLNGKEVKMGDTIEITSYSNIPNFGKVKTSYRTIIDEKTLDVLIKNKIVKIVECNENYDDIWNAAIYNLMEKTGWKEDKLSGILENLEKVNLWAVTQIILKEIAIELDKNYKDHINESEHIYAISPQDGRIHEINKAHIKNYKAFPAFRSIGDAKIACSLLRNNLKSLFSNE